MAEPTGYLAPDVSAGRQGGRLKQRALIVLGELDVEIVSGATRSLLKARDGLEAAGWDLGWWTSVPSATAELLRGVHGPVGGGTRELKYSLAQLVQPPGPRRRIVESRRTLAAFRRRLAEFAPDLVVGNTVGTLPELHAAHRRGHRTLLHALEILPDTRRHRFGLRRLLAAADEVMVPSQSTAAQFERLGGRPRIVHTGVAVPAAARARAAARDPGASPITVGALGTICRRKGSDVLVAAARELREGGIAAELVLAGRPIEGTERPAAEAILAEAEALGIRHLGQVDAMEVLPEWDVLVLPSREDPFPNAVLEAMAVGVPVIGSAVGGVPEQLGDCGLIVPPEDPHALAGAIATLARDAARRAVLAESARARAEASFSIEAQATATTRVFQQAANGPG